MERIAIPNVTVPFFRLVRQLFGIASCYYALKFSHKKRIHRVQESPCVHRLMTDIQSMLYAKILPFYYILMLKSKQILWIILKYFLPLPICVKYLPYKEVAFCRAIFSTAAITRNTANHSFKGNHKHLSYETVFIACHAAMHNGIRTDSA